MTAVYGHLIAICPIITCVTTCGTSSVSVILLIIMMMMYLITDDFVSFPQAWMTAIAIVTIECNMCGIEDASSLFHANLFAGLSRL